MALNGLFSADVPLINYSLTHCVYMFVSNSLGYFCQENGKIVRCLAELQICKRWRFFSETQCI